MEFILKDICNMQSGGTPKSTNLLYYGGKIPWVTISDFKNSEGDIIYNTEQTITEEGLAAINGRFFKKNTLLLAMYGSVGKTALLGVDASTNQAILGLNPKDESLLNIKFLKYWLDHNKDFLYSQGKGATLHNISLTIVQRQKINLPDLETQNKIVAILDKAKAILDKREKTIKKYDELLRATFLEMFGDPCNPQREDLLELGDLILEIKSGWSPVCEETPRLNSNQSAILKQGAVSKRIFDATQNKLLPLGLVLKKAVYAEKGNLLFSRKNTPELVGATAYIFEDYENLLLPDTIFKLKYDTDKISGIYLYFLFNDLQFRKKIQNISVGQAKSMSNISQTRLLQLVVPVPDLVKQLKFEEIVLKTYDSFYHKIKYSQSSLNLLLKSISQQVFSERITIDIDTELEALIDAIDLSKKEGENKIETILNDVTFIQRLIDRLEDQEFEDQEQYDKVKYILFRIMKEEPNLIKQDYDSEREKVKLVI